MNASTANSNPVLKRFLTNRAIKRQQKAAFFYAEARRWFDAGMPSKAAEYQEKAADWSREARSYLFERIADPSAA